MQDWTQHSSAARPPSATTSVSPSISQISAKLARGFAALALLNAAVSGNVFAHNDSAYSHDATINANYSDWMKTVPGSRRLKDLSIIGTHDTMALYWGDIAQTQSMSLATQLTAGIREIDIRCRRDGNRFTIWHGISNQYASFDDVLNTTTQFLREHQNETVFMAIQEEGDPINGATQSFIDMFNNYVNNPAYSSFFARNVSPDSTLDSVRGKIVLIGNFSGAPFGLNSGHFNSQNLWVLNTNWDLYHKWELIKDQFNKAAATTDSNRSAIYFNSLSASTGSFPYFVASGHSSNGTNAARLSTGLTTPGFNSWYPDFPRVNCFIGICTIAFEGTNTLSKNYINATNPSYVGIVSSDFPGIGLIESVISINSKVMLFSGYNYTGGRQFFNYGSYNVNGFAFGDNALKSLKVPQGVQVTLYEHPNYQGRSKIITADTASLGDFDGIVSSLTISPHTPVTIYEHAYYGGRAQALTPGRHNLADLNLGNDILSSLRVAPGWKVTLYEHSNFTGRSKTVTADNGFTSDFNDLTSSIVVERLY